MGQTSVERLHERLDVLRTSFPPPPSWIQDGDAGNDVIQNLGRVFRSLLWRWRKMAPLPLPVAILDDLICGNRKWGHPRWRPEAEGPPFSSTSTIGIEKLSLYYYWAYSEWSLWYNESSSSYAQTKALASKGRVVVAVSHNMFLMVLCLFCYASMLWGDIQYGNGKYNRYHHFQQRHQDS